MQPNDGAYKYGLLKGKLDIFAARHTLALTAEIEGVASGLTLGDLSDPIVKLPEWQALFVQVLTALDHGLQQLDHNLWAERIAVYTTLKRGLQLYWLSQAPCEVIGTATIDDFALCMLEDLVVKFQPGSLTEAATILASLENISLGLLFDQSLYRRWCALFHQAMPIVEFYASQQIEGAHNTEIQQLNNLKQLLQNILPVSVAA